MVQSNIIVEKRASHKILKATTKQLMHKRSVQNNINGKLITLAKGARQNEWVKISESNSACPSCGHPYPSSCCRWLGNWCPGQLARASFLVDAWDKQGNNKRDTVLHPLLITFLSALAEMHVVRNPTHLAPAHTTQSRNNQEKLSTLKMQETYLQSPEAGWLDQYDQNLSLKSSRLPLFQAMCLLKSAESLATSLTYLPVRQDSGVTFR